jgi:hypothetical protein
MNYRDIIKMYNLESLNYNQRYEFYKMNSNFELWKFFSKRQYSFEESYFRDCEAVVIWFRVMKLKQPLHEAVKEMSQEIINHYGEDIPSELSYIAEMCDM